MKKIFPLVILFLLSIHASAAVITIKVDAPSTVEVGEEFSLKYVVSTREVENFTGPKFPNSIRVLYDLARSEMSSYQIINGKSSSISSTTFTYTLCAEKTGTLTIPSAAVQVKGKKYNTRAVTLNVIKASDNPPAPSQTGKISGKDLFIAVSANKTNVYEQEPIVLTYKIYTRVNLTQMTGKMPDLKGFLIQEVPLPQQKTFSVEQYNGQNYNSTVWCQYVMFPQQSGKLEIPSIKFDGVVAVANPNIDPFDAFFNGNTNFAEVQKSIIAPSLSVNVNKLPAPKPANFSGAVGDFKVNATLMTKTPRTNENLSVRVTIEGAGNMKLITAPKLNLGPDFDVYTPKLTDKTKLTASGIEGTIYYDYVVVPRHKGNYILPAIDFGYFDIAENNYKTVRTSPIEFKVEQGANSVSEDSSEALNGDITDIYRGVPTVPSSFFAIANGMYYITYLVVLLLFVAVFVYLKHSERFNSNAILRMQRKAKRMASERLKQADRLMKSGDTSAFYDELTNALQMYVSNRFAIPMSEFKGENLSEKLLQHGVSAELSSELSEMMSQCEFARYAPGDPQENMENLFKRSSEVISKIENILK